ncbi:MAG: hypothetical protein RR945_03290 [Erysipelotrichaceae bacterium]
MLKKSFLFTLICSLLVGVFCIAPVSAQENAQSGVTVQEKELSYSDVIKIADPYIEMNGMFYQINNKEELENILGNFYFQQVQERIVDANKEISESSKTREAVKDVHIAILRANGNTVTAHWWGKKIKTYGRTNAINTRKLTNSFSGAAGDAGIAAALAAAGISFIPGFGAAGTVAGVVVGLISWADATTWNKASTGIANKIDAGRYYLTIDINAWNMDVQVYVS